MKAHELLLQHSQEWSKKYAGKCVAIVGNKLVATGRDRIEVYEKAKHILGTKVSEDEGKYFVRCYFPLT